MYIFDIGIQNEDTLLPVVSILMNNRTFLIHNWRKRRYTRSGKSYITVTT